MPDGAVAVSLIESVPRRMCAVCNRIVRAPQLSRSGRCAECRGFHIVGTRGSADAPVRPAVPYHHDLAAQRFVAEHPDGATLDEVGQVFGVSRERIRQIEELALKALRRACKREGLTAEDIASILATRRSNASAEHMAPDASGAGYVGAKAREDAAAAAGPMAASYAREWFRAAAGSTSVSALVPLREELYSPRGLRLAAAVAELEERTAIASELVRRADAHTRGVDPGPLPVELVTERTTVAPPLEAQEEETMANPAKLWADQHGVERTLKEWSGILGMPPASIRSRVLGGRWPDGSHKDGSPKPAPKPKPAATPKPQRASASRPEKLGATPSAAAATSDVLELLARLGYPNELIGRAPRGRLVLLLDEEHAAT